MDLIWSIPIIMFIGISLLLGSLWYQTDDDLQLQRGISYCERNSTLEAYVPDGYKFLKCPIIMTKTTCTVESIETKLYQESIDKIVVGDKTTIHANGDVIIIDEIYDLNDNIVNSIIVYEKQRNIFSTTTKELSSEDDFEWYHDGSFSERMYEYEIIDNGVVKSGVQKKIPKCVDFDNETIILKEIRS